MIAVAILLLGLAVGWIARGVMRTVPVCADSRQVLPEWAA